MWTGFFCQVEERWLYLTNIEIVIMQNVVDGTRVRVRGSGCSTTSFDYNSLFPSMSL